jgi:hypothetical protein
MNLPGKNKEQIPVYDFCTNKMVFQQKTVFLVSIVGPRIFAESQCGRDYLPLLGLMAAELS